MNRLVFFWGFAKGTARPLAAVECARALCSINLYQQREMQHVVFKLLCNYALLSLLSNLAIW